MRWYGRASPLISALATTAWLIGCLHVAMLCMHACDELADFFRLLNIACPLVLCVLACAHGRLCLAHCPSICRLRESTCSTLRGARWPQCRPRTTSVRPLHPSNAKLLTSSPQSLISSPTRSLARVFPLTCMLSHAFIHQLSATSSLAHSLTHSLARSPPHLLTHRSLAHCPTPGTSLKSIRDAGASGITVARFFASPWSYEPTWAWLNESTRPAYWNAFDTIVDEAARVGVSLIPSFGYGCNDYQTCNPSRLCVGEEVRCLA
jgi:hypothetical protein